MKEVDKAKGGKVENCCRIKIRNCRLAVGKDINKKLGVF